jgi:signal transduction histidine kinase
VRLAWHRRRRPGWAHAARVAAAAAAIVGALYVAMAVAFDVVDSGHLVAEVDAELVDALRDFQVGRAHLPAPGDFLPAEQDVERAPVLIWLAGPGRYAKPLTPNAPELPPSAWEASGRPSTARLGSEDFRLLAARRGHEWVVAGESLANTERIEDVLDRAELIAGPTLLVATFLVALAIGVMASRPVEQARRRQLDFTADASHELRTPLTVIEAEVGLALSASREAPAYREALERVSTETKRLRHIVEELLFLARFDSVPPPPGDEPVDLAALARSCADRFAAVAAAFGTELAVRSEGSLPALVKAPPAWLDRLCGVLLDNACRYAGRGGRVEVTVAARGGYVSLAVEDTGPGIPPEARARLFDRFYRGDYVSSAIEAVQGTETGQGPRPVGAGLGLAIADAVVRHTGGKWRVGDAMGGGAHLEVVWRRAVAFR